MNIAPELFKLVDKKALHSSLDEALNMASRSSESIKPAPTIFNGKDSLARRLFQASNNKEAQWDRIIMNKGAGDDEWRLSGKKVAAGFIGASAFGRLASGGGIYKDADGNTDIIGVPFI